MSIRMYASLMSPFRKHGCWMWPVDDIVKAELEFVGDVDGRWLMVDGIGDLGQLINFMVGVAASDHFWFSFDGWLGW